MRSLFIIGLLSMLLLSGCTRNTEYGPCIGLTSEENHNATYRISWWNTAMAIIFSETIVVPVIVLVDDIKCPVDRK